MSISLELIEKLKERANVTYTEAKEALEKCQGDLLEALIYLEKEGKIKTSPQDSKVLSGGWTWFKKMLKTCNETRLIISKDSATVVNLSLSVVILATIFAAPLVLVGLLAALITRHKIRLEKPDCDNMKINKTIDDISTAVSKVSDQVVEVFNQK